ncbi:hypothetical protein CAP35_04105 [Chitinophagaceae bacterium IBVUCB1]|jgi:uncharacterized Fe-S cluster protein YjdI|nr:hypothetical protein CAP35_04105 [Chitinophagaceae bacterium IBVUCB1]
MSDKDITKHYTNGEITIAWKPNQCIHSKLCWTGLVEVFNPRERPWIKMDAADTASIIAQVEKCPSGALSYFRNEDKQDNTNPIVDVDTVVEVSPNGPLLIYGNITVKNKDGEEVKKNKVTALCRCGASGNKPYCDGTHVKIGFKDE